MTITRGIWPRGYLLEFGTYECVGRKTSGIESDDTSSISAPGGIFYRQSSSSHGQAFRWLYQHTLTRAGYYFLSYAVLWCLPHTWTRRFPYSYVQTDGGS